jgi:two-component SAPR family response regulator
MKDFIKKHLTNIKHATKKEKEKELWDVAGILKNRLNKKLKYDLRPYHTDEIGRDVKPLTSKSKADKIVFEQQDKWVIVEAVELHGFIITHRLKEVNLDEIIDALEWNININK